MTILILSLLCSVVVVEPPCWPLDLPTRYLTGNFMEPRDGRYHAGLDLKTYSRTGYPVLAAANGHISRLRISSRGYGQAIYLTTETGMTYVYGHLGRLRDELRAVAAIRQEMRGSYELDLWFEPQEWPVTRGQVLALSGQTATLGPHLHFEVRGPDGQPLDPLAHGFAVQDRIAPEIRAVRAVRGSGLEPPSLLITEGKPLSGRLPDLRVDSGPLYFSALIIERSDRQNHLLGPRQVRLLVDGREVFETLNDTLRWDNAHHQRLEFHRTALGQEQWLRVDARNRLVGRRAKEWLSAGRWPPGRHELELVATDRAGNSSAVSWTLIVEGPARPVDGSFSWPSADHEIPEEADQPAQSASIYRWLPDVDVLRAPWLVDMDHPVLEVGTLPTGNLAWAAAPLGDPLPPRFWRLSGLEQVGKPVQYRLEDEWALLQSVPVVFPETVLPQSLDPDDETLGVYRLRRRAFIYEGPVRALPGGVGHELRQPGVYQIMRDRSPPIISTSTVATDLTRQPAQQRAGITLPHWPLVKVPVGDHGSGVDWGSLMVLLNGRRFIAEPDLPRDRVIVELPETLESGRHRLEISVRDHAGNLARAALDLTLHCPASRSGKRSTVY